MIRDVKKRKQLENLVYERYGIFLTPEDKIPLQREVGAILEGYELCVRDVVKWIGEGSSSEVLLSRFQHLIF